MVFLYPLFKFIIPECKTIKIHKHQTMYRAWHSNKPYQADPERSKSVMDISNQRVFRFGVLYFCLHILYT